MGAVQGHLAILTGSGGCLALPGFQLSASSGVQDLSDAGRYQFDGFSDLEDVSLENFSQGPNEATDGAFAGSIASFDEIGR